MPECSLSSSPYFLHMTTAKGSGSEMSNSENDKNKDATWQVMLENHLLITVLQSID